MEHGTLKRQTLGLACSNLCVHISYVVVSEAQPKPGTPPQIICEKRWEPSDELKSVAPPLFPPSFSFSPSMRTYASPSRPIRRLAEESCMVRRRRRGRTSSLRGWQPAALLTAGRGEGEWWREEEEGRWGVGREYGEGGGNPMRHREERQREGNASQHRESLSPSCSPPTPPFLCVWSVKNQRTLISHSVFSVRWGVPSYWKHLFSHQMLQFHLYFYRFLLLYLLPKDDLMTKSDIFFCWPAGSRHLLQESSLF